MRNKFTSPGQVAVGVAFLAAVSWTQTTGSAWAATPATVVDAAAATVEDYASGEYAAVLREQLRGAGGVIVFPAPEDGGVTSGRRGWVGVGLARDAITGTWSYPAFFTVISGTFGQAAGLQVQDAIFVVKSGMEAVIAARVKLETEAGLGISTVLPEHGTSTPASALTDIVALPRLRTPAGQADDQATEAYVTFEGTVLEPTTDWNHAYYGSPYSTNDILMNTAARNPNADPLRQALADVLDTDR